MTVAVAIDGGSTKTDVALVSAAGELLAWVRGGPTNHEACGVDGCAGRLDRLVRHAANLAGVDLPVRGPALAFLSGADYPSEVERLTAALTARGWAPSVRVANDVFAVLRAGTDAPDAVAVVCGSGINCAGIAAGGREARFPAVGRISGDWGGGTDLGEETLWHAVRAEDGRGPPTALQAAVAAHFGKPTVADVTEALHFGTLPMPRLAELTPLLLRIATTGDPVATTITDHLADEITLLATTALRRLDLTGRPVPVVLGGTVLATAAPIVLPRVRAHLARTAPTAHVVVVTDPPVLGAALATLDHLAAPPTAHRRLRGVLATMSAIHVI